MAEPVTPATATAPTPFNIAELNEGVQRGLDAIGTFYSGPYTALYGVAILAGFVMIVKDNMKGGALASEIGKWFTGVVLIILLFVVPSDGGKAPAGFSAATSVINSIVGGLNAQAGKIPKLTMPTGGIDISSKPMMFEKYAVKVHKAREDFMVKHQELRPQISEYVRDCQDPNKLKQSPPQYNYLEFQSSYRRDNAPAKCGALGTQMYDAVMKANQDVSQSHNIAPSEAQAFMSYDDPQGRILSNAEAAEVGENRALNAVQQGLLAILLKVLSIAALIAALIYANVIPYFIGLTANLLVMCFPIVVAMAMLPGQWGKIVTYFEGYLWLMFIPVVVTAVDGATFSKLAKAGLFDLDATLLVLGKIAIVMSAPAIAGFVLFGQKGNFQGMSGVSGMVGGAAAAAIMMAGRAAAGAVTGGAGAAAGGAAGGAAGAPAGLPPGATPVASAAGGGQSAGRGGLSATDINRTPSGMIESAPTFNGPVNHTTPGSRQALQEQDSGAIAAMRDHASGASSLESGARTVSSDGGSAYTGTVSSKGFSGAMAQQCTEAVNGGASVGVMSSGGGVTSGVVASKSADGGLSFAPMNAANAGDVAMAQSLNRGETVNAMYMPKGTAMTANDLGQVSFAPIRNGKEMPNASTMAPKEALKNLSRMNV